MMMIRLGKLSLVLSVAALSVGVWGVRVLQAEPPKTPAIAPASGKVTGIVTDKKDNEIMVKAEGEAEAKPYLLAAPGATQSATVQAGMKSVFASNLVVLEWKMQQDQMVLTAIHSIMPKERVGMVTGIVVACDPGGLKGVAYIDVKPAQGPTERYWPGFSPAAKGFDPETVKAIAAVKVGDKVSVAWYTDERKRVKKVTVVAPAPAKPAESPKPKE